MSIASRFRLAIINRDWSAALIDVGVVALGILMAIAVDEWRDERAAIELEQEILINLHREVITQEQSLESDTRLRVDWMASLAEMRKSAFDQAPDGSLTNEECNSLGPSHIERWTVDGLPSIEELVASGNVSAIRDPVIRSSALRYLALKDNFGRIIQRFESRSVNLPARFPEQIAIHLKKTDDPDDLDGLVPFLECDFGAMRSSPVFLASLQANFAGQTSALQFVRLQLLPQLKSLHLLLDERLEMNHH